MKKSDVLQMLVKAEVNKVYLQGHPKPVKPSKAIDMLSEHQHNGLWRVHTVKPNGLSIRTA